MPSKKKVVSALNPGARLLPIPAIAEYLGCTSWQARTLVRAGKFPHIILGKRIVVDKVDLDAFVDRRKAEAL